MTGILLTAASIGVMVVSGVAIQTVFTWFNNIEIDLTKKNKDRKDFGGNPNRERISDLKNRVKPSDF